MVDNSQYGALDDDSRRIFLASTVHKLPETSLENFYINRFGRVLYSMFFESYH
ncbi:MAG: hypothetical protein R2912_05365 [Eubacteriales bacterium]